MEFRNFKELNYQITKHLIGLIVDFKNNISTILSSETVINVMSSAVHQIADLHMDVAE